MKKITIILTVFLTFILLFSCIGCEEKDNSEEKTLRFTAPEGTPALAILRLPVDNKTIGENNIEYEIVSPSNIAAEMSAGKSDLVIMPVNAGATLIKQGADYKLVSVAVDGSLYMIGRTEEGGKITFDDILGKKVACIGKTGVPGLIFRFLLAKNNINVIEEGTPNADNREVLINYVADGPSAKALLLNTSEDGVDFAVVGEPAATTFSGVKALNINAQMDLQEEYKNANENSVTNYPQAGLFVRTSIANDIEFMNKLFSALSASKEWVVSHTEEVDAFAKENLYESASFPKNSIARCAINGKKLTTETKQQILSFLNNVAPKDAKGNVNNWNEIAENLFVNE